MTNPPALEEPDVRVLCDMHDAYWGTTIAGTSDHMMVRRAWQKVYDVAARAIEAKVRAALTPLKGAAEPSEDLRARFVNALAEIVRLRLKLGLEPHSTIGVDAPDPLAADFRSIDLQKAGNCRKCGWAGTYATGYGKIACVGCGLILCNEPAAQTSESVQVKGADK